MQLKELSSLPGWFGIFHIDFGHFPIGWWKWTITEVIFNIYFPYSSNAECVLSGLLVAKRRSFWAVVRYIIRRMLCVIRWGFSSDNNKFMLRKSTNLVPFDVDKRALGASKIEFIYGPRRWLRPKFTNLEEVSVVSYEKLKKYFMELTTNS